MANDEVELQLLKDYFDAALNAKSLEDSARNCARYTKQLESCMAEGVQFNTKLYMSLAYYLEAIQKISFEGAWGTLTRTVGYSGIADAMSTFGGSRSRKIEAVSSLDKAIDIWGSAPDYWLLRARLHYDLNNKQAALRDVNHVLSNFADDKSTYIGARKLKDDIDALRESEKKKDDCFIATAVYGTPDAVEVQILRQYRDQVLTKSLIGRTFIRTYYRFSPPFADMLRHTSIGRQIVRLWLIAPVVRIIQFYVRKDGPWVM